jgi:2-polyprenyl-3-methyl-5-hydroxy-6-metoxy-1,4-benzoquinol methylase
MADSADTYIQWKDWRNDSFGRFDRLDASYYAAETGIDAMPGVRVLEIGFGNGSFIGWARSVNAEVFGVELNSALVGRARTLLGEQRVFSALDAEGLTKLAGTFSHVIAFDVIEHIQQEKLPEFLRQLRTLLAVDGRVILRFPNGDSPFGRINQHGDPTHVSTLGREKLHFFARQAGLGLDAIRAPRLPVIGVGIARGVKRGLLSMARRITEHIVGFLYYGGRVIPLDPNYVVVLVRVNAEG